MVFRVQVEVYSVYAIIFVSHSMIGVVFRASLRFPCKTMGTVLMTVKDNRFLLYVIALTYKRNQSLQTKSRWFEVFSSNSW